MNDRRFSLALLGLLTLSLIVSTGCRNRFGGCIGGCLSRPFTASTRIATPPTYSLQIPTAQTQPYYNQAQNPNNSSYPGIGNAPANRTNPAWQPAGSTGASGGFGNVQPSNYDSNVYLAPNNYQTVTATGYAHQTSRLVSPDYSTTRINEQYDSTRMPMTDASLVRAPAGFAAQPTNVLTQTIYNGAPPLQTPVPGNLVMGQVEHRGQLSSVRPYSGYMQPQGYVNSPNPRDILAESTTSTRGNQINTQAGWRDGTQTASQPGINR